MDIINSILYLIPEAKFAAWNCALEEYQGEGKPIKLGDVLIDWHPANKNSCPTLDQIEALDPAAVSTSVEARRKTARDAMASKNIGIMCNYNTYIIAHPAATLTAYLDMIESSISKV